MKKLLCAAALAIAPAAALGRKDVKVDVSGPLDSRATFEAEIAAVARRYDGGDVPRPPHWSGYRLTPLAIEFWHDRPFRLHDRLRFTRPGEAAPWTKARLYP